jgi:hypothetical protein
VTLEEINQARKLISYLQSWDSLVKDDFNLVMVARLVKLAGKALEQLEKARREEMEACCKDVCWRCKETRWPVTGKKKYFWHKNNGWLQFCDASPIRQRWQQQGQGQEERGAGD